MNVFGQWFYWAIGVAIGFPVGLILLTEWHVALARRDSYLARPVALVRNYLLPLGALLVLLAQVAGVPGQDPTVRVIYTLFGFVLLVLLLSGLNVTFFQSAPKGSWRNRIPTIFVDVARFLLIGVGLALILSHVWGAKIGGLFTALGVTSVVIGLMLQNSVGQIVSGLFMLFEQPFRIGDWLSTPTADGRVVEVNWRAVHISTGAGLQVTPNSVLAGTSFTNVSRSGGAHRVSITTTFAVFDPPDRVCALLSRVAAALPQRTTGAAPCPVALGSGQYRTSIALDSPDDDGPAHATFLRWLWYAARREGLHLDDCDDEFSTPERVAEALRTVVAPALRLTDADQQAVAPYAGLVRYGADEILEKAGQVPTAMIFLTEGSVRLTARDPAVPDTTLRHGAFLGVTTLTRQASQFDACALEEVTAVVIDREHIEDLVMAKPLLLQELGRVIDQRRHTVSA
ncbi:mechanosensitive ion channel family protein [Mycolicibacter sp. MYC123]|uniref:Mechanosensitive ion channel family protein n=1 Tax=[Mycobacterium] zoologicum TaxID=2872311 RepID=A0ABU5YGG4_9MYCO|nr:MULTISPECIES: mechanosensitive ion channel family protein [unclassified Mycolicibacter]MEB3049102.1 mechanosensitive ion channel family protein [Mycolicibacter sp. MYC123]MEB3061664.1 mechanosensitive ion channel family protein [Mycolicibacter sp. MYC101]